MEDHRHLIVFIKGMKICKLLAGQVLRKGLTRRSGRCAAIGGAGTRPLPSFLPLLSRHVTAEEEKQSPPPFHVHLVSFCLNWLKIDQLALTSIHLTTVPHRSRLRVLHNAPPAALQRAGHTRGEPKCRDWEKRRFSCKTSAYEYKIVHLLLLSP